MASWPVAISCQVQSGRARTQSRAQSSGAYQGAEQAVMALQSVAEFMGRQKLLRAAALQPVMRRLLDAVAEDEKYRPAIFQQTLRDLRTVIETGARP